MIRPPFTYGSVCSGIEAATMAWHPFGWQAKFFSEIEAFPSAVLAHHYGCNLPGEPPARNGIPNHGDFTKIGADAGPVDLLVGGTPCQPFSVAGKRLGLDDPRGNLALEYLALAKRLGARWFVWENVPGVLSSVTDDEDGDGDIRTGLEGRSAGDEWIEESDFATFLSFVRECGYGFAYRVLDAQYVRSRGYERAVPQRRRRVFVVGYLGDWRPAAAVLLDPEGMRGHHPPRREAGQGVAGTLDAGLGVRGQSQGERGHLIAESDVSGTVSSKWSEGTGGPAGDEVQNLVATREVAATLTRGAESAGRGGYAGRRQEDDDNLVAHTLRAEGHDASEDGTGRGVPLVAVPFDTTQVTSKVNGSAPKPGDPCHPLAAGAHAPSIAYSIMPMNSGKDYKARETDVAQPLMDAGPVSGDQGGGFIAEQWAVRKLTPRECERLQGFPDDFTSIPWRGKAAGACPDGPRYKALGNSMAVNVMRWIGERIDIFETEVRPHL